jgi:alkyl hydroperoxide reductase subunit AhpC
MESHGKIIRNIRGPYIGNYGKIYEKSREISETMGTLEEHMGHLEKKKPMGNVRGTLVIDMENIWENLTSKDLDLLSR